MLKIGTRDSALAVWQARLVQQMLEARGYQCRLEYIKTDGDKDAITPLYALGVEGIFTKALDSALLSGNIDIAVHSMKDVPVDLAAGITAAAVLKRGNPLDVFVPVKEAQCIQNPAGHAVIATCSIRRKAQWLRRFPFHTIESIRGNVDTRLQKLYSSHWDGAIFAAAGLERLGVQPPHAVTLDWMIPAPAQGAILVVCRTNDHIVREACQWLHDEETGRCVAMERTFLKALLGGCTAPISALALPRGNQIFFKGQVLSPDGMDCLETEAQVPAETAVAAGLHMAETLLARGADALIRQSRERKT